MTLTDLATRLELTVFTPGIPLDRPVQGGYASDLLSDVIGHARKDDLWVTMQVHPNIVAVAVLKELIAIVLVGCATPSQPQPEYAHKKRREQDQMIRPTTAKVVGAEDAERSGLAELTLRTPFETGVDGTQLVEEFLARADRERVELIADLAIYLAGADPFSDDRLGRLALTKQGLLDRDRMVFDYCARAGLPVAVTMAGGYGRDVEDTVDIHVHTIETAAWFCSR